MKITSPDDLKYKPPKRFPRKTKKKMIKTWGRDVYKGILKGYYILAPFILKTTKTILLDENGRSEFPPDLNAIYGFEKEK
jgi:hypothetical protein